jgi:hypothetical protein
MAEAEPGADEVWWIDLPEGGGSPVTVWVDGAEITEGAGLEVRDGRVHLERPLRARPRLGVGRKVMLAIGIGVYGDLRGDSVDLRYTRAGRTEFVSDLRPPPTGRPGRTS